MTPWDKRCDTEINGQLKKLLFSQRNSLYIPISNKWRNLAVSNDIGGGTRVDFWRYLSHENQTVSSVFIVVYSSNCLYMYAFFSVAEIKRLSTIQISAE